MEAVPRRGCVDILLDKTDRGAMISIRNEGVVPAEIVDHFFDKYATSGKSGGTGLGTYSAQLIAKMQNGIITMETSEEEGTMLKVFLPLG